MKRVIAVILLVCLALCGCGKDAQPVQQTHFCMNTVMDLKVWGNDAEEALTQIKAMLNDLDNTWSTTQGNSILGRLNRGESVSLTDTESALLEKAEALSQRTGGAFNPKLRSLSLVWGFYHEENQFDDFVLPTDAEISTAIAEAQWDLGAALKGYAGQEAAALLEKLDVTHAMLNLGGNVQTYGSKPDGSPWQVAVQNPNFADDYIGIVSVTGTASIVTSGDYQRNFEKNGVKYHHILDPETGYPADSGLSSVTVICRDGMTADCLSTALFVMGLEEATEFWRESDDFEAVFITTDGMIYATEGANFSGGEFEVIKRED